MVESVKLEWCVALRSGAYEKTTGHLKNDPEDVKPRDCHEFCVLGVLCDLYARAKGLVWRYECGLMWITDSHIPTDSYLPPEVEEWAGLPMDKQDLLVTLNDNQRKPFVEIADYIEQNL